MMPEGKMQHQHQHQVETITTTATDKNVMPSMVVRQQRQIQMGISAINPRGLTSGGSQVIRTKIDEVNNNQQQTTSSSIKAANELSGNIQQQQQLFDQDGLVLPKRVLHHPISAAQPIIRDLNRELKFNKIRGKNVLDQKSELKKALEKLEENKRKKEAEQERMNRRTSLELRLEERAEKIAKETTTSQTIGGGAGDTGASSTGNATCNPLSNFSIRSITR